MQLKDEVDTVIIACTDLNVVASEDFVDSSQCLANAVVRMYLSNTKEIFINIENIPFEMCFMFYENHPKTFNFLHNSFKVITLNLAILNK